MAELVNQSFRHESNVAINYVRLFQGESGLDITNAFETILLQEDIEKGFVTGSLTFLDDFLTERDAFIGIEELEISFTTANENFELFDPYEKRFKVTKVESTLQANTGTTRALKLSFVSKPSVVNDSIKLSRIYTNTSNSAFVDQCCDVLGVTIPRHIEETLHSKTFMAPNVSPLDMINWIKTTSQSKVNNGADFYFFENRDGIHFKCMESMKAEKPTHRLVYKPNIDNFTYNVITKLERPKGYDIQDDYRYGGIGCTVYTHDLITKRYNSFTLDPSTIPTLNPVNPRGADYGRSNNAFVQFWPHNHAYSTMDLNSGTHSALIRSVTKTLINFKAMNLEMAGNVDVKTGDVVELVVPGYQGNARIDESGLWIVKKLRHMLTRTSVTTQLEVISDSNIERNDDTIEQQQEDTAENTEVK